MTSARKAKKPIMSIPLLFNTSLFIYIGKSFLNGSLLNGFSYCTSIHALNTRGNQLCMLLKVANT